MQDTSRSPRSALSRLKRQRANTEWGYAIDSPGLYAQHNALEENETMDGEANVASRILAIFLESGAAVCHCSRRYDLVF